MEITERKMLPTPRQAGLAETVLLVLADGQRHTLNDIVAQCGFSDHLAETSRRQYAIEGIHWARITAKARGFSIPRDPHTFEYFVTTGLSEGVDFRRWVLDGLHTRILTLVCNMDGISSQTKAWKLAKKDLNRLLEDIEEILEPA